jgi:hypothetical protein
MGQMTKCDWSKVDWSKNDTRIAKELPVSRERVRQMRAKLGQLPSAEKNKVTVESPVEKIAKVYSPQLSIDEMAAATGICYGSAMKALKKLGLKAKSRREKYDWQAVDWSKLNTEIAEELGAHIIHVTRYRKLYAPEAYKSSPYRARGRSS